MNIGKAYSATDVHVAGEAFRIIRDAPLFHYRSLVELDEQFPHVYHEEINLLLNEPRGFAGLNGCLVVPPFNREADAAVVFFNHEGTVPLQYGGGVAVVTALLECGQMKRRESNVYKLETVSGILSLYAVMKDDEVISVELDSSYYQVAQKDIPLDYTGINTQYSLVLGEQLYAVFNKSDVDFQLHLDDLAEVQKWGRSINEALGQNGGIHGVVLLDDSQLANGVIKTITFRRDNYIVRSPGFETSAVCFTLLTSKGGFMMEGPYKNESIFKSHITAELAGVSEAGYKYKYTSRGFITGMQTYLLDPTDPLAAGFLLK